MINRLKKIATRHGLPVYLGVPYEVFIRLYAFSIFRSLVRVFISPKQPMRVDFVIGSYNSGTTIIKDAIAAHPSICSAPIEGDQLSGVISNNECGIAPRAMMVNVCEVVKDRRDNSVDTEKLISDLRPWLVKGKIFLEKSISNTIRINKLRSAFPGSKYICVTRSVDGVVKGIKKRSKPAGVLRQILAQDAYPDSILLKQWRMFYSLVIKDYQDSDVHFVSYEKFLESPVEELQKIFEFMGLDEIDLAYSDDLLSVGDKALRIKGREKSNGINYLGSYAELLSAVEEVEPIV